MATVAGSPSWVEPLSWTEQLVLNGAAFALGGAVAYMLATAQSAAERERSARLHELHAKLKVAIVSTAVVSTSCLCLPCLPCLPCCRPTRRSATYGYSLPLYRIRLQADSALNHMLKNKFASSQFLLTLVLEQLDEATEAEATRGRHANGAAAPATAGANGAARSNTNGVVNGTNSSTRNGSSSSNNSNNSHLASSFEPKEKPKRGPASLVRQVRGLALLQGSHAAAHAHAYAHAHAHAHTHAHAHAHARARAQCTFTGRVT